MINIKSVLTAVFILLFAICGNVFAEQGSQQIAQQSTTEKASDSTTTVVPVTVKPGETTTLVSIDDVEKAILKAKKERYLYLL